MKNCERKNILLLFGGMGAEHKVSVMSAEALFGELSELDYRIIPIYIEKSGAWLASRDRNLSPIGLCRTVSEACDKGSNRADGKSCDKNFCRADGKSCDKSFCRADGGGFGYGSSLTDGGICEVFPTRRSGGACIEICGELTKIDAAIPALHGDFGEDGCVQGALLTVGIPFVGCDVGCGALCADKSVSKLIAESLGIKTVDSLTVYGDRCEAMKRIKAALPYPVFIKPTDLGSSLGASCAECDEELAGALKAALSLSRCALAEKFVKGARELECAFFEHKGKQYFTNVGEIRHSGRFYGYGEKYESSATELALPTDLSRSVTERIRSAAEHLVTRLGCRHLSRLDFFLGEDGELYFNEINTMPGLTSASMFPYLARTEGFSLRELFSDFIEQIC